MSQWAIGAARGDGHAPILGLRVATISRDIICHVMSCQIT